MDYWWQRMEETMPVWQMLQATCRQANVEVMYTVMESLTRDGRDRSLDYKISGRWRIPMGTSHQSKPMQVIFCRGSQTLLAPKKRIFTLLGCTSHAKFYHVTLRKIQYPQNIECIAYHILLLWQSSCIDDQLLGLLKLLRLCRFSHPAQVF